MNIAITTTKGTISLMQLIKQADGTWPDADVEVAKWTSLHEGSADGLKYASHRILDDDEILPDPSLHDAWVDTGSSIVIDESKIPAAVNRNIEGKILEIELAHQLPRATRELLLTHSESAAYLKVKAVEDEIQALRSGFIK